ncbi:hypothetical protein M885DRAFT_513053 [Pelagophyceae sp. CCMP2097]|nr:hypothetical protein M885DRAFT_513053 [Pelagophyceae sp. CCMP2097]
MTHPNRARLDRMARLLVAAAVLRSCAALAPSPGWEFTGRFAFAPALVRAEAAATPPGVDVVSLFGWTLGGFVALEYDSSPVGPYLEVVDMGAVVFKGGGIGQWGRELTVSTAAAEKVCKKTWGVPARRANIGFDDGGNTLTLRRSGPAAACAYALAGWAAARSSAPASTPPAGERGFRLPVLWTPEIKALWAPVRLLTFGAPSDALRLHDLRLSATSLRISGFRLDDAPGFEAPSVIPLGFALTADGVAIEIAPFGDQLL